MKADAPQWKGAQIYLEPKNSSVGATVNVMMASCLAEGNTTIENAAREPEVVNLAEFLNKMGGRILGAGTSTITIEGVKELHGAEHAIYTDRIEGGTFLAAAAVRDSDITITGLSPAHLPVYLDKLASAGLKISTGDNWIRAEYAGPLKATDITTAPFPGFATDLQPPFLTMMCCAAGRSVLRENLYEGRFAYTPELVRMGGDIDLSESMAIVNGVKISVARRCKRPICARARRWFWPVWARRAAPKSPTSNTLIAATKILSASCARWADRSCVVAWKKSSRHSRRS